MKAEKLKQKRNKIEAQITFIEQNITDKNHILFVEELLNLADGVGEGFVNGDYYATDRYYSNIPGVKNIRYNSEYIIIKVVYDSGYLLPKNVIIRDFKFEIIFDKSRKYDNACSY